VAYWIDALANRSGPLLEAAVQFSAAHGLEPDPPRGVAGLQALSALIANADADLTATDEDERRFVAGAGAYLALLLLDHLPVGSHVANAGEHRLRLGSHGYFDPFGAVNAALDASDVSRVRRALIEAVKLAEAEAAGHGPTARALGAVLARLAAQPEVRVVGHFDRRLFLEVDEVSMELDLARVIEVSRDEPTSVLQHAIERLCASLVREQSPVLAWPAARSRLFPRLVGPAFLNNLPSARDLHLTKLGDEVWMSLVLRFKDRARYVRQAEVDAWAEEGAAPRTQALYNLAGSGEQARFLQHATAYGPLVVAESRDGLDAARLLLPGLHEVLSATLGSPFIAAVPHRDTLLACPAEPAALVDELQARVEAALRSAPHAISGTLFLVSGPGLFQPLSRH
jgi:hypothetical protein